VRGHPAPVIERSAHMLLLAAIVAILIASIVFAVGPARGARNDIARTRAEVVAQHGLLTQQLAVTKGQLDLMGQLLAEQRAALTLGRSARDSIDADMQKMLRLLEDMDRQVREMNSKLP